jgi:hypothetical protein
MICLLQRRGEKFDELGNMALVNVTQGSVFRHFDDPDPGVRYSYFRSSSLAIVSR